LQEKKPKFRSLAHIPQAAENCSVDVHIEWVAAFSCSRVISELISACRTLQIRNQMQI